MKINFKVKSKTHTLEVEAPSKMSELKEKLHKEGVEIQPKDMKFIATGKILKDDQTVDELKLVDGCSIFVTGQCVKKENTVLDANNNEVSQPQPTFAPPMNHPQAMPHIQAPPPMQMNNDAMKNMMQQQFDQILNNPNLLDFYFGGMLQGKSEAEKDNWRNQIIQQMKMLKDNPELMQTMMEQMGGMDPAARQDLMSSAMYSNQPQPPAYQGMPPPPPPYQGAPPSYSPNMPPMNPYYQQYYYPPPPPHYYPPPPYQQSPTGSYAPPSMPSTPVNEDEMKKTYQSQLEMMANMGFPDDAANLKALIHARGDVNRAIDIVLQWQQAGGK